MPRRYHEESAIRRHWLTSLLLALLLVTGIPAGSLAAQGHGLQDPQTPDVALSGWIGAAIQPDLQESVAAMMPQDLATYEITATLHTEDADAPAINGHLVLTWTNITGDTIDALPFRLYANSPADDHDAVTVTDVTVDGQPVETGLSVGNSVLDVPLDGGLDPGDTTVVDLSFSVAIPVDATSHYGIFNADSDSGTLALAHWYPVLAGRDPVTGWVLDPPSENGDPIFSDTALYDVTITAPDDWAVVTTGVTFGDPGTADGTRTQRYVSGPARDFTIVADADFELVRQEVNGVTISSWYNPGEEETGEAVADYTAQAIELFDDLLGAYPYTTLDMVPVEMYGAAGCEFPQLIYMGRDYYTEAQSADVPNALDFTVAHEVVHQWFYGLVGNNQYQHAFIDEGLTQFLSAEIYFGMTYNTDAGDSVMESFIQRPFERLVNQGTDWIVDTPTDDFPTGSAYGWAAYSKAPMGFAAIHDEIGNDAFFAALQQYVAKFTFRVAQPSDLLAAFGTASGEDIDDLWRHWFNETNAADDVA